MNGERAVVKWLVGVVAAVVLLCAGVAALLLSSALHAARPVGFQIVRVADPGHPPLAVAIWYPTTSRTAPTTLIGLMLMDVAQNAPVTGEALPLVVISHGNGGGPGSHADTAMSLAASGFVVAAPMHTGDNYRDQSLVGSSEWLPDRSRHVRATIDYMLATWRDRSHIASSHIGVFGFSAGALTALTAIGAQPDFSRIAAHCSATPEFACALLRETHSGWLDGRDLPAASALVSDQRIGAAVVAAPGLGFTLTPAGLAQVTVPVQLWSGNSDTNVPYATNTLAVREGLRGSVEFHAVPGARHFSFLAPCPPFGPPLLCSDAEGFDRRAFHRDFNAQVSAFFQARLRAS